MRFEPLMRGRGCLRRGLRGGLVIYLGLWLPACRSGVPATSSEEVSTAASVSGSPAGEAVLSEGRPSSRTVRPPAVAGQFYPGQAELLRSKVEGFLAAAEAVELPGRLFGLMVPHAGYDFCGQVAASA